MNLKKLKRKIKRKLPHFMWIFSDIKWWFIYRTTQRYNIVHIGKPPGYYQNDDRMFFASFSLLVEFVEVELAYYMSPKAQNYRIGRFKPNRTFGELWLATRINDPYEDGFHDYQKDRETYKEIWDLYVWYKDIRPTRPDPTDSSGYSQFSDLLHTKYKELYTFVPCPDGRPFSTMKKNISEDEDTKLGQLAMSSYEIEQKYEAEDNLMFERLLKVRSWLSL